MYMSCREEYERMRFRYRNESERERNLNIKIYIYRHKQNVKRIELFLDVVNIFFLSKNVLYEFVFCKVSGLLVRVGQNVH